MHFILLYPYSASTLRTTTSLCNPLLPGDRRWRGLVFVSLVVSSPTDCRSCKLNHSIMGYCTPPTSLPLPKHSARHVCTRATTQPPNHSFQVHQELRSRVATTLAFSANLRLLSLPVGLTFHSQSSTLRVKL